MRENLTNLTGNESYMDLLDSKDTIVRLIYLIIVSIGAVSGNMLVFVAILKFQSLRRSTNVMLGSLAFADFLVGTVTVPLYILWMTSPGIFDSSMFMCGLVLLSCLLVVTASQISLLIMSVEQYFAVCHPFLHRNTLIHHNRLHTVAVTSTWVISFLTTALSYLAFNTKAETCSYYGVFDKTFLFVASIFGVICPFVVIISLNVKVVCAVKAHDKRRQSLLSGASSRTRAVSSSSYLSSKFDESVDSRNDNYSLGSGYNAGSDNVSLESTKQKQKLENKEALLRQLIRSLFKYNRIKRIQNTYIVSSTHQRPSRGMHRREKGIFFVETRANAYIDNISPLTFRFNGGLELVELSQTEGDTNVCLTTSDNEDIPQQRQNVKGAMITDNTNNIDNLMTHDCILSRDILDAYDNKTCSALSKTNQNKWTSEKRISSYSNINNTDSMTNNNNMFESVNQVMEWRTMRRYSLDPDVLANTNPNFEQFCLAPRKNKNRSTKMKSKKSFQVYQNKPDDLLPSMNQGIRKRDSGLGREISAGTNVSRRVANMVALVCASFIVAWCPFFVVVLMNNFCSDCDLAYFLNAVIIVAFTKSATNPLVYALCHVAFRRAYRKLLTSLCMMKRSG